MMKAVLAPILALALAALAAAAHAQPGPRERGAPVFKGSAKMAPPVRRRETEAPRADPRERRFERMSAEDREKLRRDIEDANRGMERRR